MNQGVIRIWKFTTDRASWIVCYSSVWTATRIMLWICSRPSASCLIPGMQWRWTQSATAFAMQDLSLTVPQARTPRLRCRLLQQRTLSTTSALVESTSPLLFGQSNYQSIRLPDCSTKLQQKHIRVSQKALLSYIPDVKTKCGTSGMCHIW